MRIVSGIYGGRTLVSPKTRDTRPMTDKVRAALFDAVGDIGGAIVLDAYAGSGAVGIEALSRGASQVVFIDKKPDLIRMNLSKLDISWGSIIAGISVEAWLARSLEVQSFDLIVADPPYDQLREDVIEKLGQMLGQDGVLVLSQSSKLSKPELEGLELYKSHDYGDSSLSFYKKTPAA
jgi:16S rRNA (guanine966-N2)-methyltransferase